MTTIKTDFSELIKHVEAGGQIYVGVILQKGNRPIEEFPDVLRTVRDSICYVIGTQGAAIGMLTPERANDKEYRCTVVIPRHIADTGNERDNPSYFQ